MTEMDFIRIKLFATAFALGFALIIQARWPYRQHGRSLFLNWGTNFSMAGLNLGLGYLITRGWFFAAAYAAEQNQSGLMHWAGFHWGLQIVVSLVMLDLLAYLWHIVNHRWSLMWRLHQVHHSDVVYDASTAVRFHFGEVLISSALRVALIMVMGIPLLGLILFEAVYVFFNFFEHGNIRLASAFEQMMAKVFITPALHRKHHSIVSQEMNSNYGTIFSFWDRLFRTMTPSSSQDQLAIGIQGDPDSPQHLVKQLLKPFVRRANI